jgi:hypothetical protein
MDLGYPHKEGHILYTNDIYMKQIILGGEPLNESEKR